jgi:hypothetical protein
MQAPTMELKRSRRCSSTQKQDSKKCWRDRFQKATIGAAFGKKMLNKIKISIKIRLKHYK